VGNDTVAIKVFSYKDDHEHETRVWNSVDDPAFFGVGILESMDLLCLVLQRYDASLYQLSYQLSYPLLQARQSTMAAIEYRQIVVSKCIASVLEELVRMHEKGWVHMDIKSPNIMVRSMDHTSSNFLKMQLVDFGRSVKLDSSTGYYWNHDVAAEPVGGAYSCMPLEVLRMIQHQHKHLPPTHSQRLGPKVDSFSVGVMLYNMILGEYPNGIFPSERKYISQIMNVLQEEAWKTKKNMSLLWSETKDFLNKSMAMSDDERWSCKELKSHPFLSKYTQFL
jgi:serine/threonine protein kinase